MGVVAQGGKQVIVGDETLRYVPGQSMLTTIDLPVISHVTTASANEPFLGLVLRLDARMVLQAAAELGRPRRERDAVHRTISIETLDAELLDALLRLVKLLERPDRTNSPWPAFTGGKDLGTVRVETADSVSCLPGNGGPCATATTAFMAISATSDPLSLLCRLATSVPPPRLHTLRYAGVPDPASPWRSRLAPRASPVTSPRSARRPRYRRLTPP